MILFGIFPYVAVALAVTVGLYRFYVDRYSYSSHSSQFLESRMLFWGSVPWHYAILLILLAHLLAFLIPSGMGALLGSSFRLVFLEVTGFALGICAIIGVLILIFVYIALTLRWGSVWYMHTATPWLWSLVKFNPQVEYLAKLPWVAQLHAFNAFLLVALFPFSRLVHLISVPLEYLWRPYQVVIWYRQKSRM
jgi:nitrate reductase gamma subunit